MLSLRQRNQLFRAIAAAGLDLNEFDSVFEERECAIRHRSSGSHFSFVEARTFLYAYAVTDGPRTGAGEPTAGSWEQLLERISFWADEIRYVTTMPDLWQDLRQARALQPLVASEQASNTLFTTAERAEVARQMDQVTLYIREAFELTAAQMAAIERGLGEVKDASNRLGRKDWKTILYGTVLSLALTDLVPAHVVQTILTAAVGGLAHMLGLGPTPPPVAA